MVYVEEVLTKPQNLVISLQDLALSRRSLEVVEMCRGMDKLREESIEIGRRQGIKQGIKQGMEISTVDFIKKIMESLKCTEKQAMEILQISAADQRKYKEML